MYADLTLRKRCSRCVQYKSLDLFTNNKTSKDGKDHYCKLCKSIIKKEDYVSNRDKIKEQVHRSYQRNKDKCIARALKYRTANRDKVIAQKRFASTGVNQEQYEEMLKIQDERCAICNTHQSKKKLRLAADHCHTTKVFRGLLCGHCNTGIGLFKDNIKSLEAAIEYLKKHQN